MTSKPQIGPMLRLVLGASAALSPLARPLLTRRLKRGKEDPDRWHEKLGEASVARPDGPLIWMHGVGLGEAMALRGLIARMSDARPELDFLVTSSARSSGEVFAKNLPPRTQHQYLALDFPAPVRAFLDHWQPDLAVWSDQEVWPRLAVSCARRGVPQAYVAARITDKSAAARARFGRAYGDLYRLLDVRHAQEDRTAAHLSDLMGDDTAVTVTGALKAAAAPLVDAPEVRAQLPKDRFIWLAASAHPADVEIALDAQVKAVSEHGKDWLLIVAPRLMKDVGLIEDGCKARGLTYRKRSENQWPDTATPVFIADSFGELGSWYRAATAALIGGSFNDVEGHNPWEAVALDCAVLHGPRTRNFAQDYAMLDAANAAREVAQDTYDALCEDLPVMAKRAANVRAEAAKGADRIAQDLMALLKV